MFYTFHTPHFPHSAFSTLFIFHTSHFPHSAFSTLLIFHTQHFPHSSFSTLLIFHSPHFPHSALFTPRFPPNHLALFLWLSPDAAAAIAVADGRRERNGRFGGILHCKEKRGLAERNLNSIILIKLIVLLRTSHGQNKKKMAGKVCMTWSRHKKLPLRCQNKINEVENPKGNSGRTTDRQRTNPQNKDNGRIHYIIQ